VPFEQLSAHFVRDEGSGILNWMIVGALKWLRTRRLPILSKEAEAFGLSYRQSVSPMGEWYMDCCDHGEWKDRLGKRFRLGIALKPARNTASVRAIAPLPLHRPILTVGWWSGRRRRRRSRIEQ
jgi:hypothetical protein